jgi:curved DNA-binding protein CbpA
VTRQATTSDIKTAYYQLAKKFHPDRHRNAEHLDLRSKLEALFSLVTQAYDTLSEPSQRAAYDDRLRGSSAASPNTSHPSAPIASAEPRASDPKTVEHKPLSEERKHTGELKISEPLSKNTMPLQQLSNESVAAEAQPQTQTATASVIVSTSTNASSNSNPSQQAEHYYQQGRARYDRKEYHAAVHLLREAVKLDSTRALYHYHLGVALIRNPRTRREAEEHLSKAAELEPYNAQVRIKLGILYKESGLPKKAENYFRQALQIDPDNRLAKRELNTAKPKVHAGSLWKSDLGSIAKRIFKK